MARSVIDGLRRQLQDEIDGTAADPGFDRSADALRAEAEELLDRRWRSEQMSRLRRTINATGVIIHTNLGRAPLSAEARRAISDSASGYCTLEYDLESGKRGQRGRRTETLLIELTGAEDVLIVNNCAAAAFFVLTVFAAGGEVVISRGELVEIGGDFRVPDVLSQSGASLREVGTTNRTKLADYEKAIGDSTRLILRVHPSNYRIVGFTAVPSVAQLSSMAHRHDLLLYEDLGSGALVDLSTSGLSGEPVVRDSIDAGVDVVTFSGDKLLGGPQAGIIAGKSEVLDRLRKHPLYRALRVDKLAYAALEATLESYRRGTEFSDIPVLKMLSTTADEINERAVKFRTRVMEEGNPSGLRIDIVDGVSAAGGGAAPDAQLSTRLLALSHPSATGSEIEKRLRLSDPPVIARIVDDRVMIDLRTVTEPEEAELLTVLGRVLAV
jgi:L-seryl-tRNA(Ser) seleniumtransferase